jgi:glutamate-5-semialdehyde dehydrogenase
MTIELLCDKAKANAQFVAFSTNEAKNEMLLCVAAALKNAADEIVEANKIDLKNAVDMPKYFVDRLTFSKEKIDFTARTIAELCKLPDPTGEVIEEWTTDSKLHIIKRRVPLGVLGVIYEARPNVTADTIALAIKSGNAVVLRGSKDAINTNKRIVGAIKDALAAKKFNPEFIQLIDDVTREGAAQFMKMNKYIDVLIPRGSAGLIESAVNDSTIPVIETGTGNCHIYVEKTADLSKAEDIIINAKCQAPSVCNACESLLIDAEIAKTFLPAIEKRLSEKGVEIRGCEKTRKIIKCKAATEDDYAKEFLDFIISVKIVGSSDEAIAHVNKYGTKHSDAILTRDKDCAQKFLKYVDAACVYLNASTRFSDGYEFGLGSEIGISTQKLHARGPMGLKELTTYKYEIIGNGQIRK